MQVYEPLREVRAGVPLPSAYAPLPVRAVIVEKYPNLLGYRFVDVDGRIVIVQPKPRKVVYGEIGGSAFGLN
jgi:hypothetical protein